MDYLEEITIAIKPKLQALGYKKKSLNWYSERKNTILIFNLQKSLYSKQIYVNIGGKIKDPKENPSYTFPGCHISTRLDNLIPREALDFEKPMNAAKRTEYFVKLIVKNPYGFFTLSDGKAEILEFVQKANLRRSLTIKGSNYLGLPES